MHSIVYMSVKTRRLVSDMMTSSNGNIFRVTGVCAGNSPVTGEFPAQRPVTRSFDVSLVFALIKRLSKRSWGWWFETPTRWLWRHCNGVWCQLIALIWSFCIWICAILTHCGLVPPYGLEILINTSSGNGLLPDGPKSLPGRIWLTTNKIVWQIGNHYKVVFN